MKKILLGLVFLGALALAAVQVAIAAAPPECGKSYAMLITGALQSSDQATGGPGFPGALTAAAGVGVISFAPLAVGAAECAVTGELIFNAGDMQTSPAGGVFFGPTSCYDGMSESGAGVPCFDGNNHFSNNSNLGQGAHGSQILQFTAGYGWLNGTDTSGIFPAAGDGFVFYLNSGTGGETAVGASQPTGFVVPPRSILSITLQKIGVTPVATAYGSAPYLGESAINCSTYMANQTDPIAGGEGPAVIAGSFVPKIGPMEIFANGQANGNLTFDGISTGEYQWCTFSTSPGTAFGSAVSQFADGTSNAVESFTARNSPPCKGEAAPGAGYATSSVAWGSTDKNAYVTITGLLGSRAGFTPPGGMSTCTSIATAPAGKLTAKIVPAAETVTTGTNAVPVTKSPLIVLENTSPGECHVSASIVPVSAPGIQCNAAVTVPSVLVDEDAGDAHLKVTCTCGANTPAETDTYNVSLASSDCPIASGAGPTLFTCKN